MADSKRLDPEAEFSVVHAGQRVYLSRSDIARLLSMVIDEIEDDDPRLTDEFCHEFAAAPEQEEFVTRDETYDDERLFLERMAEKLS